MRALVSSTPASTPSAPGSSSGQPRANSSSGFETSTQAPVNLWGCQPSSPVSRPPMDIYSAARLLMDHFKFAEGVGMDDSGQGAGDDNIGLSELKRLAQPQSGAPAELREAARFLLDHPTARRAVDQGASLNTANPHSAEVYISRKDLEAFTANAPSRSPFTGSLGAAQLARQMILGA